MLSQRGRAALLAAILTSALYLRVAGLANESPWGDEATTLMPLAADSLGGFLETVSKFHPLYPLYYVIAYAWAHVVGDSALSLRMLSVLFGLLGIVIVWRTAERLLGPRAALFTAMFLAWTPLHIQFSQEIRFYAMSWCLVALCFHAFVRLWETPQSRLWRIVYATACVASVFTHPMSALAFPVHAALWLSDPSRRRQGYGWCAFHAVAIVLVGAWTTLAFPGLRDAYGWMNEVFLAQAGMMLVQYAGGGGFTVRIDALTPLAPVLKAIFVAILLTATGWGLWTLRRPAPATSSAFGPRQTAAFLLLWTFLPPLLLALTSLTLIPCFLLRYTGYASFGAALLVGMLLDAPIRARRLAVIGVCALLATQALMLHVSRPLRADWRAAAAYIQREAPMARPAVNNITAQYALAYALGLPLTNPGHPEGFPPILESPKALEEFLHAEQGPVAVVIDPMSSNYAAEAEAAFHNANRPFRLQSFPGRPGKLNVYLADFAP